MTLAALVRQEIAIDRIVVVAKEHAFAPVAALRGGKGNGTIWPQPQAAAPSSTLRPDRLARALQETVVRGIDDPHRKKA